MVFRPAFFRPLTRLLRLLAALLTEPSSAVTDSEQRRQARLLSILLLIGAVCLYVSAFVRSGEELVAAILLSLIYLLSRTRYYGYARWAGAFVLALPSFAAVIPAVDQGTYLVFTYLAWLVFPVLLVSLVSPVRDTLLVTLLLDVGLLGLALAFPVISKGALFASLGFLGSAATLIITATAIRQGYLSQLKHNLQQLQETQAALRQTNQDLSHEIAVREQAQLELAEARDQALESLELKARILANVSHDARTPLSVIMLRAEMMKRGVYGKVSDRQLGVLDSVLFSANDLLGFINNLLQGSRLDTPREIRPDMIELIPAAWLGNFIETIRPLADRKNLSLTLDIDAGLPQILYSDPAWLRHILSNLISNAIKFTESGSVAIRAYRYDTQNWAIAVTDTGVGIPAAAQSHIFEAFWQVDGSTTRSTSRGVGLGLSIVHNLTHLLGGRVEVASQPNAGSTFTVILPLEVRLKDAEDKRSVSVHH